MKSKKDATVKKGMVFAGCSFTWGQGLYYYSNLSTLKEPPPDEYDKNLVLETHKRFKESVRYPRIVANHFNTFELVHPANGGSNQSAMNWWKHAFNKPSPGLIRDGFHVPTLHMEDVSHLVFQLTQWQRDNFILEIDNERHDIPFFCVNQREYNDKFLRWLDMQQLSLGTWVDRYIQSGIDSVKEFLQSCEDKGIKTFIFTWPHDLVVHIEKDPWLNERFIKFDYKSKNYKSIEDLMSPSARHRSEYNPELTIKWDQENFEVTPKDHHPSLKCHQVMAENVIREISKRG